MNQNYRPILPIFAALFLMAVSSQVLAVYACFCSITELKSNDGAHQRCGELRKYDDTDEYEIDEEGRGISRLPSDIYAECPNPRYRTCKHPNKCLPVEPVPPTECPECTGEKGHVERFGVYGSNTIGEKLIPALVVEYGNSLRWYSTIDEAKGTDKQITLFRKTPENPELVVDCKAKGSATGIPALIDRNADIAMLSRPIRGDEIQEMRRNGFPGVTTALQEHVLALDGLAIIVPSASRVQSLTLDELAAIFSRPGNFNLYLRDERSGTRLMFEELVMPTGAALPPCGRQPRSRVRCFPSNKELAAAVARDPRAIGFVSYASLPAPSAAQPGIRPISIAGNCGREQTISRFEIKSEDYLLSRRLFLYTAKVSSRHSPNFVLYALSEPAQNVIAKVGFVDQGIERQSPAQGAARIRGYRKSPPSEPSLEFDLNAMDALERDTSGNERLSISFRFRFGSSTIDSKAWQDIYRLADYLTVNQPEGRVILLGFTDAWGSFATNQRISEKRAHVIKEALEATGILEDRILAKGYSELLPIACNDSEQGRARNRRVEVYLLPSEER